MEFEPEPRNFLGGLNLRIARHKNRDFLNAVLAVSALATEADGTISFSERCRIDDILASLERVKMYDNDQIVRVLDGFLTEPSVNPGAARARLFRKIERVAEDRKTAQLIVRIALSVNRSGGNCDAAKRARVAEVCTVLGYAPESNPGERRQGA